MDHLRLPSSLGVEGNVSEDWKSWKKAGIQLLSRHYRNRCQIRQDKNIHSIKMYKSEGQMTVTDTLSRAALMERREAKISQDEIAAYVHSVIDNLPISTRKLNEMQTGTENGRVLQLMK